MRNNVSLPTAKEWSVTGQKTLVICGNKPFYRGKHNLILDGKAINRQERCSDQPVVVKCRANEIGNDKSWEKYLTSASKLKKFAEHFNIGLKVHAFPYRVSSVSPMSVCMDTVRSGSKLSKHEVVVFEEDLQFEDVKMCNSIVTFTNAKGELSYWHPCGYVMDAFAHYIYTESNGTLAVCKMMGTCSGDNSKLLIPHVHTTTGDYGDHDRGLQGIEDFRRHHRCNDICREIVKHSKNVIEEINDFPVHQQRHNYNGNILKPNYVRPEPSAPPLSLDLYLP